MYVFFQFIIAAGLIVFSSIGLLLLSDDSLTDLKEKLTAFFKGKH